VSRILVILVPLKMPIIGSGIVLLCVHLSSHDWHIASFTATLLIHIKNTEQFLVWYYSVMVGALELITTSLDTSWREV
jgi:hypothetical protein